MRSRQPLKKQKNESKKMRRICLIFFDDTKLNSENSQFYLIQQLTSTSGFSYCFVFTFQLNRVKIQYTQHLDEFIR